MKEKRRLDVLLCEENYFESREKAKAAIMAGLIFVDDKIADKPGMQVMVDANIEVAEPLKYVSRGGYKLEKALNIFNIDPKGKIAMDIGASTGGFTDCLLQNGAEKVYAVDVGYGQLDYSLRTNDKVVVLERTNVRHLDINLIREPIDIITIDVSFISLNLIFPKCVKILKDDGCIVSLIKPQFEAGKDQVGKGGIVKNPKTHVSVIKNVINYGENLGLFAKALDYSPIKGAKGNIEYLLLLSREDNNIFDETIESVVKSANSDLIKKDG